MKSKNTIILLVLAVFALSILILQPAIAQDDTEEIDCLGERAYHIVYADDIADGSVSLDSLSCAIIVGDLRFANLSGADLSGANLRFANLYVANLRGANLRDADLRGADLSGADLRGADLRFAFLRAADLGEADLSGADLRFAFLRAADLGDAMLPDGSEWTEDTDMEHFTNPDHADFWTPESD